MNNLKLHSPFPFKTSQSLESGIVFNSCLFCQKNFSKYNCADFYSNLKFSENIQQQYCKYGFLVSYIDISGEKIILTSILGEKSQDKMNPSVYRESLKNKLHSSQLVRWIESYILIRNHWSQDIKKHIKSALQPYHDIKRLIGNTNSNCELLAKKLSQNQPLEQALENAPEELKAIHKSMGMIDLLGSMSDALANPDILATGSKNNRAIHKSFHKSKKILEAKAKKRKINFELVGASHKTINAFESFDLLAFILLENAAKYSFESQAVQILFNEEISGLDIDIINYGPLVEPEEIPKLFDLNFRGNSALLFTNEGSGIGLHLASEICKIHHITLSFKSEKNDHVVNNHKMAKNTVTLRFAV